VHFAARFQGLGGDLCVRPEAPRRDDLIASALPRALRRWWHGPAQQSAAKTLRAESRALRPAGVDAEGQKIGLRPEEVAQNASCPALGGRCSGQSGLGV